MRQTLKPGGLLIFQGYTPKQIEYATGGPKPIKNLYTREMLEGAEFHCAGAQRDHRPVEGKVAIRQTATNSGASPSPIDAPPKTGWVMNGLVRRSGPGRAGATFFATAAND